MSIEKQIGPALEIRNQPIYHGLVYFDADQRFSREDFDSWPEGKLDKDSYRKKLVSLKERGFREFFPQITLTKTEFQSDAKFLVVQTKDSNVEAERVLREIETETEKKWQLVVIVETYEQNQQKMRIFIREKYSPEALNENAKVLRDYFGGNYLLKKNSREYPDDYICWVIEALEEGRIEKARLDYEQQGEKWKDLPMSFLEESLFDDENMSTRQRIKKWSDIDN